MRITRPTPLLRRPGHWLIPSRTTERVWLVAVANGEASCNCPGGFSFRRHCYHERIAMESQNALALMDEETQQALAPVPVQRPASLYPTPLELQSMFAIARNLPAAAGVIVPRGTTEGAAFAKMLAGFELGIGPMASQRHIVAINGRAEPDAQLMMGICIANDPTCEFRWGEVSAKVAELELWRRGRCVIKTSYRIEDAERAGQTVRPVRKIWPEGAPKGARPIGEEEFDGPWQTHTHLMLAYNAAKTAMKLAAPDLINGVASVMAAFTEADAMADGYEARVIGGLGNEPELKGVVRNEQQQRGNQGGVQRNSNQPDYAAINREFAALLPQHDLTRSAIANHLGKDTVTARDLGEWLAGRPPEALVELMREVERAHLGITIDEDGAIEGDFREAGIAEE